MPFLSSISPDITEGLPAQLPGSVIDQFGASSDWDVSIGALGFRLRPSEAAPYRRVTDEFRKQQFDASNASGEQSLSSWWTRSQNSWDAGAGLVWYEPGSEPLTVDRFATSQGVDVWTPGQVTLLPDMVTLSPESNPVGHVSSVTIGGTRGVVFTGSSSISWRPVGGSTVTQATSANPTQPSAAGGRVFVGHDDGVSEFDGATVVDLYTHSGSTARAWWAKSRLLVAVDGDLYECPATAGDAVEDELLAAKAPSPGWVWTDVAEVGGAILAAGFDGERSAVYALRVAVDEGVPVLLPGVEVVQTPPGESILCMGTYLGSYVVLGTTAGVRIGVVSDQGEVRYGPLLMECRPVDVAFRDRFAYVAVENSLPDGSSGAVRIDLSREVGDAGRFAWAWDVATGPGPTSAISVVGSDVYIVTDGSLYVTSGMVTEGWLDTGRIRFGTGEPKAFRLARLVARPNGGTLALTVVDSGGSENRVVELDGSYDVSEEVAIRVPGRALNQFLSFRVYLRANPGATPVLEGLTIKAVPAPSRVRLFQFPLSVFDEESDRYGNRYGGEGQAFARVSALEQIEESSRPVVVTDNRTGESFVGQIDSVDFVASAAPDKQASGFGGVARVVIRRV